MGGDVHGVGLFVTAPAAAAFAFMADPVALGRWSLGCFDLVPDGPDGLHRGHSLFDGGAGWVRIAADPVSGLIDYHVGTPNSLAPRIFARVVDGGVLGRPGESLVSLTAMRAAGMAGARWDRLRASHEAEIWLIKHQIETRFAGPDPR